MYIYNKSNFHCDFNSIYFFPKSWFVHNITHFPILQHYYGLYFSLSLSSEGYKALDVFLETVHECGSEDFLLRIIQAGQTDLTACEAHLYLTIIDLLEMVNLPELVVNLATVAIDMADSTDPNVVSNSFEAQCL